MPDYKIDTDKIPDGEVIDENTQLPLITGTQMKNMDGDTVPDIAVTVGAFSLKNLRASKQDLQNGIDDLDKKIAVVTDFINTHPAPEESSPSA
jgi:hypothetical protein